MADFFESIKAKLQTAVGLATVGVNLLPGGRFQLQTVEVDGGHWRAPVRTFKNMPDALADSYWPYFEQFKDVTWIVFEGERITFGQARKTILAAAAWISDVVKPGDRVGIAMRNFPEFMLTFVAIQAAGAVAVPLNSLWKTEELEYAVKDASIKVIFADPERLRRCEPFTAKMGIRTVLCRSEETEGHPAPIASTTWAAVLSAGDSRSLVPQQLAVVPEDESMIMYTSGSTGFPKGVVHTQRSVGTILKVGELGTLAMPSTGSGVLLLPVPLFHITGIAGIFLRSISSGSTLVMMRKWDAKAALDLIENEQVTGFMGVPTMVRDMMDHPSFTAKRVASLKSMAAGGAPVPPTQVAKLKAKAKKIESGQAYGLTEVIGATVITGAEYDAHPKSCGKAIPLLVELKIKDPETGADLPIETRGEVCIRSAMVMQALGNFHYARCAFSEKS